MSFDIIQNYLYNIKRNTNKMEFCNIKEIKKIFKYDKYRMSKENIIKKM